MIVPLRKVSKDAGCNDVALCPRNHDVVNAIVRNEIYLIQSICTVRQVDNG